MATATAFGVVATLVQHTCDDNGMLLGPAVNHVVFLDDGLNTLAEFWTHRARVRDTHEQVIAGCDRACHAVSRRLVRCQVAPEIGEIGPAAVEKRQGLLRWLRARHTPARLQVMDYRAGNPFSP